MIEKLLKNYYTNTAIHGSIFTLSTLIVLVVAKYIDSSTVNVILGYTLGLWTAYTHRYLDKKMKELNSQG